MIYKFIFFAMFLLLSSFFASPNVYAGDGSITGWGILVTECNSSGFAAGPMSGAGNKWATFSPSSTFRGHCQTHVFGKGKVCVGSTNYSATVVAGTSHTWNFSTCSDGGNSTSWRIIADFEVVGPACTPESPQTQTINCPPGQTGSIQQQRTSSCPGPTWGAWTTTSNTCVNNPYLSITTNPTSAWAPGGTTISWTGGNHPGGTTCTNNWNSFLNINPNAPGSDYRVFSPGNYNFTITCSNGTSASVPFTVTQLPPPTIQLTTPSDCNNYQPRVNLRLTAPTGYPGQMYINLSHSGGLAYQVLLNPGQSVDVSSTNFYPPYSNLTPNGYTTFYATTNVSGLTSSSATSLPVFIQNCPSPPTISSASPSCNTTNNLPYTNVVYQNSTYGAPSAYHLDRTSNGQPFTSHGQGYIGTYYASPIQDYGINNNTLYSYRMRADNGYQSTPSNVVSTTSQNCTPPTISAELKCVDNSIYPQYTLGVTSPSNIGRDMYHSVYLNGYGKLADFYMTGPNQTQNKTFTSPQLANNTVYTFYATAWHSGISPTPQRYVSISSPDCTLPRPFNLTINTSPTAICPAQGLPKINIALSKSANAITYEVYTYKKDGSGNYSIPVPSATRTYTSEELFPSSSIISSNGTANRQYDVEPNGQYGTYVLARNSNGSWIYSNWSTANTSMAQQASDNPWVYATLGWCDTTPPTIQLASLAECFQPNQLPTNIQLTVVDNPASGAPSSSTSNINPSSVKYLLNTLNAPSTVQEYPYQNQSGNIYNKSFSSADFFDGIDKDYQLSARACDFNNNCTTMNKVLVSYAQVCGAWIQTRQGNVHSEKEINTPGGPQ